MDITRYELSPDKLRWSCDPSIFDFKCTEDIAPLREFIGQDRAIGAIEFGLSMNSYGYNIYVSGVTGTGKTSVVRSYIQKLVKDKLAGDMSQLKDWCYVYNFVTPDRPQILDLPQGKGKVLKNAVSDLLQRIKDNLARAFASEEYQENRKKLTEESQAMQQALFSALQEEAQQQGFVIQMTQMGPATVPVMNGKPLSQTDYMGLPDSERKELDAKRAGLVKKLEATAAKMQQMNTELERMLERSDKEIADFTVAHLFEGLEDEYRDMDKVSAFLAALRSYTLDNLDIFKQQPEQQTILGVPAAYLMQGRDPFLPFQVNVFVDNSDRQGPPVIEEPNPTFSNMFGKIERRFLLGGYLTDHTMLKPGALHLANGGYLLLSARDVLLDPAVWLALKRAIKTKEVGVEDALEMFGLITPQGMRPQTMPVDVKVVLIGDVMLYHLLATNDEEFWETFKVKADFNYEVDRTNDNMIAFAAFIKGCCEGCQLRHFDPSGVAKVIEHTSRMASDQEKMSTRFAQIKELVQEAEYWARKDGAALVSGPHVDRAVREKLHRHNLPDEKMLEMMKRGTIMIDTDGAVVGQVNGLSVYMLGDIEFGKPSRITCRTFLGRSGVVNIEREAHLSGSIHDKGVLILSGYMGWQYAQEHPLSLSASLCFEQSYDGVEGDSASSAELYALLSSISDIPIKQSIAVTGSINQKGEIQPIGGVNHKIEGFFDVCRQEGLTGEQGVMIPQRNVSNLMLREDVVDAVREGKFHIYAVTTVDEGIEILTGVLAGKRKKDGSYPKGSINFRVQTQLREMVAKLKQVGGEEAKKDS